MRSIRAGVLTVLSVLTCFALVLWADPAAAGTTESSAPTVTAHPGHGSPVTLASTGLDLALPVTVGLSALVLGVLLVAWAFLRRTPAGRRP